MIENKSYILNSNPPKVGTSNLFFDQSGGLGMQRYELTRYPIVKKLADKHESLFWRPSEIDMTADSKDYKELTVAERHIFISNLQRQILLDSVQGRAPSLAYLPIVTNEDAERFINFWTMNEGIHSQTYTHIIRAVEPNPSWVFDQMNDIPEIVDCSIDVTKYYDDLIHKTHNLPWAHYETKRAFYLSMVATNALEQIRFHVSFACTFSFGNRGKMTCSARQVKLIRRDESMHCAFTQYILNTIVKEDEDFKKIAAETKHEVDKIYNAVYQQELEWIDYLFSKGSIVGLTKKELIAYLQYLTAHKMRLMKVDVPFDPPKEEPLPWLRKYLNEDGADQVAPQEEELTNYQEGNLDMNINADDIIMDF